MKENIAYKFVKWEISPVTELKNSFPYLLLTKVNKCEDLTREEKNRLYRELQGNSYSRTGIPLQGWMFDFSKILKPYIIKFNWGHLQEVYAPDKTSIRAYERGISKIIEV